VIAAGKHNVTADGTVQIGLVNFGNGGFHVGFQGLANIDLVTGNSDIHNVILRHSCRNKRKDYVAEFFKGGKILTQGD
jgi:hypothetical protein